MKKTLALLLLLAGLSVEAQGDVLTWTGAENSDWRFWDVTNWVNESGNPTVYKDGDAVVFNDAGARFVYVWEVSPGNILVENNSGHEYYFKGEGQGYIGGPGGLTKKGEGSLTISIRTCTCDYAGSTDIYGGSIVTYADAMPGETFDVWLGKDVIHLYGGALHVDYGTLRNNIIVDGTATLYCGYLGGTLTLCDSSKLTLTGFLAERGGDVILKDNSTLDLGGNSISSFSGMSGPLRTYGAINVEGNASIGNGEIINCMLNVEEGKTLTLLANTSATSGTVFNLGEGATLNLGGNSVNFVDASISASGNSAGIGNGTITGDLTVAEGKQITLLAGTTITGGVNLGDNASLDLGKNAVTGAVTLAGSATIGNGTINGDLAVADNKSLVLLEHTTVTGGVSLGAKSSLNLGGNTVTGAVTLSGSATLGKGSINGDMTVAAYDTLTLCGNLSGTGTISLGDNAKLDMGGFTLDKDVSLTGDYWGATIGNGTLNGDVRITTSKSYTKNLMLSSDLSGEGSIYLSDNTGLALNWHTLTNNVFVSENATAYINGGTLNGNMNVAAGATLSVNSGNVDGKGTILLGEGAKLNLGNYKVSTDVALGGKTASIGNGKLGGNLAVGEGQTLTLISNLEGTGTIHLGTNATLDLGSKTTSTGVIVNGSNATIRNGTIYGNLTLAPNASFTWPGEGLALTGGIFLGYNATLDLGKHTLSKSVTLDGISASIGNGAIESNLLVGSGKTLSLSGNLSGTGTISLGDYAALNLGTHELSANVSVDGGHATLGNGSIGADGKVTVNGGKRLTLSSDLSGTGTISLQANATLDLGGHSLSSSLSEKIDLNADATKGPAIIGNGTIEGTIHVPLGKKLTLLPGTSVTNSIMLDGNSATLDLGGNTFKLDGIPGNLIAFNNEHASMSLVVSNGTLEFRANCELLQLNLDMHSGTTLNLQGRIFSCDKVVASGNVSLGNGKLLGVVEITEDSKLTLCGYLAGVSQGATYIGMDNVAVTNNATLDLNGHAIYKPVILNGPNTTVGNGTIDNKRLSLLAGYKLTLLANTSITGDICLNNNSTLDLGGNTFHVDGEDGNKITLDNAAPIYSLSIGNGTLDGNLEMKEGQTITLCGNLGGTDAISMATGSELKLGSHTLSKNVTLNGTSTVTADKTTIKALNADKEGLLKELSVSDGLIAGTDRQASLADGLDISRMGQDLKLENLVLTANNKISVGDGHAITLQDVTIKLSQAHYELVDGSYYFNLKTLINCDLDMDTVTFDASGLSLGTAMEKVVFDFGEDVNIDSATRARLQLDEAWYGQAYITGPGLLVFSKSAPIPEPATGTLSLLALAALAARRRRK